MAKMTNEELIAVFKEMTLLELSEFVRLYEDEFDVTAAAPAAVAVAAAPGAEAAVEEEKTEFDVVLESFGSEKIQVIKAVRALTGLGLKEAKGKVDGVPSVLLEGAKKEDADKAKADIEAVGGTVTLK